MYCLVLAYMHVAVLYPVQMIGRPKLSIIFGRCFASMEFIYVK